MDSGKISPAQQCHVSGRSRSCQGLAVWKGSSSLGLAVDSFQHGITALGKGSPAPGAQHRPCPGTGEQLAQHQMPKWNRSPHPQSGFPHSWIHIPVAQTPPQHLAHAPRDAPPLSPPCSASRQLQQTREPSSLCLLLLLPLPRSGGRAQLGLSVPETSTGKWEWLVLLPARLPAREALALSPQPGTLGREPRPAWGRRRCWCCSGPLGSIQRGCFPSKQHCSTATRRDLQCREKPPTRHAAACGQGGSWEQLCSHSLGSTSSCSCPLPCPGPFLPLAPSAGIMETL